MSSHPLESLPVYVVFEIGPLGEMRWTSPRERELMRRMLGSTEAVTTAAGFCAAMKLRLPSVADPEKRAHLLKLLQVAQQHIDQTPSHSVKERWLH